MEEIIFSHPNVSVIFKQEPTNYLQFTWRGMPDLETYKQALLSALKVLETTPCRFFLIDQRELEYVGSQAQAWLSVYWFPKVDSLVKQELHLAIIQSKKLYAQLASNVVAKQLQESNRQYIIHYFEKEKEAIHWLFEPKKAL